MKNIILFSILAGIILVGCSNSQQEKEKAQKATLDSLTNVIKATQERKAVIDSVAITVKENEDQKFSLRDQISDLTNQISGTKKRMRSLKANLEVEYNRLEKIKEFQLLRTSDEREAQIRNQSLVIQNVQGAIEECESRLKDLSNKLTDAQTKFSQYK